MFEWFPIFHGKYFTYQEFIFILDLITFSSLGVLFILIGKWLNRSKKTRLNYLKVKDPLSNEDYCEAKTDTSSSSSDGYASLYTSEEALCEKNQIYGTKAGNASIWVGWYSLSLLPGSFAVFNVLLPTWLAGILDYSILLIRIRYKAKSDRAKLYQFLKETDRTYSYEAQLVPLRKFYRKLTIIFTFATFVPLMMFDKLCVSGYQDYVGPIFGTASISTAFTRYFQISKACPPGPPCHIYATLPEDASTSVFINAHTDESYESITIHYDTDYYYKKIGALRHSKESVSFEITGMESSGRRRVQTFYLDNLEPDTRYYFQLYYDNAIQAQNYYHTLPDENNPRDLIIVQGGDMGDTSASRKVTLTTGQTSPDLIVIGGDVAYDNGMCTCFFAWDYLFKDLTEINTQNGRLIPLMSAVGNHDVGLDSINGRTLKVTSEGPFYMVFFPQQSRSLTQEGKLPGVPSLEERKSYHYHKIGKLLIINLDSGYLEDIGNEQSIWMRQVLDQYPNSIKFANYHCPIYFACKGHDIVALDTIAAQRQEWLPIFDEYKFAIAFENHEHHLKRTFPLKNDTLDSQGTLYIGNGQWGTDDYDSCASYNQTGFYEHVQNIHHFWIVNVSFSQGIMENTAYDENFNPIVATVRQNINDFILD